MVKGSGADGPVVIGAVVKAHGIRGEVVVEVLCDDFSHFGPGRSLKISSEDGRARIFTIESVRPHQDRLLVKFSEVPDRTAAEQLRGGEIQVRADELAPLPEGEFYQYELEGYKVTDPSGNPVGKVSEVLDGIGATTLIEIRTRTGEFLLPFVDAYVDSVSRETRTLVIRNFEELRSL